MPKGFFTVNLDDYEDSEHCGEYFVELFDADGKDIANIEEHFPTVPAARRAACEKLEELGYLPKRAPTP